MHIFFSVGEPSGDEHAAELIRELRRRRGDLRFSGFGGPRMEAAGCETLFTLTNLAVMGFLRVLPLLGQFFRLLKQAERHFAEDKPDAVILVDFPGFNWWIARKAKAAGIPVIYYLPPQLWAWAPWRIRRMKKYIDHVLCGLPFEPAWYAERGMQVQYVGHPFFDKVMEHALDDEFVARWRGNAPERPTLALLPGSRNHEVHHNWPMILNVARRLHERHPQTRFLVANYKPAHREWCESQLTEADRRLPLEFFVGHTSDIIEAADCALMVSGSVSLEMLARATPAVVLYRGTRLFYLAVRLLVTCKFMSLPNLMAGRAVMPEFLSITKIDRDEREMTAILARWLSDANELAAARNELLRLRDEVLVTGATAKTATAVLDRLERATQSRRAAA
ncbi:MAG: lipid-A-disaccharide synthase [Planctomycetales bacterium]|nr:lipid-A-disaccharide synthase [Planctomycetales bacterium]